MKAKSRRFLAVDICYLLITVLPIIAGLVIKILTTPPSEGISISGALVYFTLHMPLQDLPITESQVNSWLVLISIFGLCLFRIKTVIDDSSHSRGKMVGLVCVFDFR